AAKLCKRYHIDEDTVLIDLRQPLDHARIRFRACPFGYDVGVEQETHRSVRRRSSLLRPALRPDSLSGEAAKNSARFPLRRVLRSHSSAATITTALRPLRVTICGPCDNAWSITSLSLALASATVQLPESLI